MTEHFKIKESQITLQILKNLPANAGDLGLIPGLGRASGGRHDNPIPVFLPEEFHGQRRLVGYSPWGHKESDMIEPRSTHIILEKHTHHIRVDH